MKFDLYRVVFLAVALATAGCSGGKGSEGPDEPAPDNNAPPVADAGADLTVAAGDAVTLLGSGSDSDGSIAGYSWSQASGTPMVTLFTDGAEASFTAPEVEEAAELVFELQVTDDDGADSAADSLTVTVLPKQEGKFFGTAVEQTGDYNQLTVYFDQLTPGNAGKWGSVESTRDQMNWTALDTAYQFAADNGLRYKHHTLIWGQQQPGWIDDLSAEEQLAEIEEWMVELKNHYGGEIDMIDVVNEPLHAPPSYKEALGGDGDTGWDWVITAFEMARAHFPDSTLILNDYNILQLQQSTEDYLEIIKLLQVRDLIDGIGVQSHFLEQTQAQQVQDNLDRLAATGLPIYVSELDINFADDARQANKMRELFSVFWQHPAVAGVTHWGYRQGNTWRTEAWLLNSDGTERPALKWLRCYIARESGCDALVPEYVPAGWSGDASGVKLEAELYDQGQGVPASGDIISYTDAGDWILFQDVEFQLEWDSFSINYAKGSGAEGSISVRLDSLENDDTLIVPLPTSGSWGEFDTAEAEWPAIKGKRDVYIRFNEVEGVGNIDWLRFAPAVSGGGSRPPGFFVGNITTRGQVRSDFLQYWDQITPENEGKWGSVEGTRDQYNWGGLDAAYNFAQQNGIPFKQHTFVWGNQAPGWIDDLSPSEQAAEIEEWIRDYCARYPDTQMIDVVNEATPGHAPAGYAQSAFGNDWIIRSFQLARQYCPNAILILNDYNVLSWNTQEFINMARPAVEAGVVDAIGLQAHGLEDWSLNDLRSKLDAVAALGLPIYISEYDVNEADDQRQLQIMQEQFPMFFSHPSVAGITLWGYVVGGTWVPNSGLIRSDGSHRPAMTWLMDFLER